MNTVEESKTEVSDQVEEKVLTRKEKIIKEAKSLFWIVLFVFAFRSVFFEPFKIPSGSMIPTLMIGDFILVNKFSYGFKLPFSDIFSDPVYLTKSDEPKRGDVVVFKYPKDTSINYIKRVIGLPGDTIEIRDKIVYVNDKPIESKEIDGAKIMEDMDEKFKIYKFKFYQTKTGDHDHVTQSNVENHLNNDYPAIKVPKGHYFVMGDNRDFSADSRYWKFVPFEYIKGKAILVWFSMIMPWSDEPFKFRFWRIGELID